MKYIKDFYKPKKSNDRKPSNLREDFEDLVDYAIEREWALNKNIEFEPTRSMNENFVRTILTYIQKNSDIRREFIALRWEPNRLAKSMLARALRVSVSMIEKAVPKRSEA
jgi:hypothetical protein